MFSLTMPNSLDDMLEYIKIGILKLSVFVLENPIVIVLMISTLIYGLYIIWIYKYRLESPKKNHSRLEGLGVVSYNKKRNDVVLNWDAIKQLKAEEIDALIEYDGLSDNDINKLKELLGLEKDSSPEETLEESSSDIAIQLKNVSKIYKLHGSQRDQLIDVFGLNRFGIKSRSPSKEFAALNKVSLDIPTGHRIGIVGRNGAGKTTLLKLLCGNFAPSHGEVKVNGTVQALMNTGLGFHPEYTGRENIEASLQYSGLKRAEYNDAIDGIISFCELGDYLDQPFKTYSLGMQARLMFASATAINPDILIVDEVLGAGDGYFVAKSKTRVEKLVQSGCTMLLVSHSMQQVLELCTEVIWLDKGHIRMQGEAFLVVKAYEEFLHGYINGTEIDEYKEDMLGNDTNDDSNNGIKEQLQDKSISRTLELPSNILIQSPKFIPHFETPQFPIIDVSNNQFDFKAAGGVSKWKSEVGLKVCGFTIVTERGVTNKLVVLRPAKIIISIIAEQTGIYDCRYGIVLDNHLGKRVTQIYSPPDKFNMEKGSVRQIEILLNPIQVGAGDYVVGISILSNTPLESINSAYRYDLLSRSFSLSVEVPDSLSVLGEGFVHSAEWIFGSSMNG